MKTQKLILARQRKIMQENWLLPDSEKADLEPVVKFFHPYGAGTWLFSELDEEGETLFGLCDLGMQCPELGYANLPEMQDMKNRYGWQMIERDQHWSADKSLSAYADDARINQEIRAC